MSNKSGEYDINGKWNFGQREKDLYILWLQKFHTFLQEITENKCESTISEIDSIIFGLTEIFEDATDLNLHETLHKINAIATKYFDLRDDKPNMFINGIVEIIHSLNKKDKDVLVRAFRTTIGHRMDKCEFLILLMATNIAFMLCEDDFLKDLLGIDKNMI